MKRVLVSAALPLVFAVIPLAAIVAPARAQELPTLQVEFHSDRTDGAVLTALYSDERSYGTRGEPLKRARAEMKDGAASVSFEGLAPGRYALMAFQDLNGDGKLNLNPMGQPTEPFNPGQPERVTQA